MRRIILMFTGVVALTLATSVGPLVEEAEAAGPDRVDCMYPFWVGFAPLHLAKELGYFQDQGITVTEIVDDDRSNALSAMARGDIDCYLRSVGEYQGRPRTPETTGKVIGVIDVSLGGDGLIAEKDIQTPCDLEGKTVAAEPNIPGLLLMQHAMKEQCGLTIDAVRLKDIATADAIGVFTDPEVDAVVAYEPVLTQALKASGKEGAHVLLSSADYPGMITDTIIARTENLESQPEKYVKLLRGIYKAVDYYRENPEPAIEIMADHFDLTPAEYKEVLKNIEYYGLEEAVEFMGTHGEPGKLHGIFADAMQLNIEAGAADVKLEADEQIDNSIITRLVESDG